MPLYQPEQQKKKKTVLLDGPQSSYILERILTCTMNLYVYKWILDRWSMFLNIQILGLCYKIQRSAAQFQYLHATALRVLGDVL